MISTVAKEYAVRRLDKGNLADVEKLHAGIYGKWQAPGYFTKKYQTIYTGVEYVGYIAYSIENEPVAYYGVIPCFIADKEGIQLSAQSADTMTHPAHRYKGMFVELSNMTFDLCRSLGIRLIFGFPNQNSFHGAITKLGWQMTGSMVAFIIPVNTIPLAALALKWKWARKFYSNYKVMLLGKRRLGRNGVVNSVLTDGFAGIQRSEDFLNYKTYSPTLILAIGKAKVWLTDKNCWMIGDLEGVDDSNFRLTLKGLKKLAAMAGIRQLQFHCSRDTDLYRLFSTLYQPAPSYPMLFQDFGSTISPAQIRFTFADLDIF